MFLKLWKYELKCSYRGFMFMYAILLLPTLFVNANSDIIQMLSTIIYACMVVIILIMTFVMIVRTYQQSMFSKNAYLTLTLPVSGKTLTAVKIVNATMWFLLSYVAILVSVMIIGIRVSGFAFSDLTTLFNILVNNASLESWVLLLNMTIGMLQTVTMLYLIMNFTHTNYIKKYRGVISVVLFIILNCLISYISSLLFGGDAFSGSINLFFGEVGASSGILENSVYSSTLLNAIILGIFFFGASYILDHKLELE